MDSSNSNSSGGSSEQRRGVRKMHVPPAPPRPRYLRDASADARETFVPTQYKEGAPTRRQEWSQIPPLTCTTCGEQDTWTARGVCLKCWRERQGASVEGSQSAPVPF